MLTQTMINRGMSHQPTVRVVRALPPVAALSLTGEIEMMGAAMPFGRNAEIYGENERADYL